MFSQNVTSVPHFSLHSGSEARVPGEIFEAHIESGKLWQTWAIPHQGGLPLGFSKFSDDQILDLLHGHHGIWKSPESLSRFPSQAEDPFKTRRFLRGCDKRGPTKCLDNCSFSHSKKFANDLLYGSHGPSRDLINTLPDELLCHVFRCLGTARDRLACASVSKRWLILQSHMPKESFIEEEEEDGMWHVDAKNIVHDGGSCAESDGNDEDASEKGAHCKGRRGDLSRCLSGRKASDVRLAAIALGTGSHGGLGKLCIRGGSAAGLEVGLTDVGLSAIGSWCSGLRVLSLWTCPYITDEGLSAIGKGCRLLEKVDLFKCPLLRDAGLHSVARNCSRLSFLNLDDCEQVGDKSLLAIAEHCPNLMTFNIQNCPRIGDHSIITAVSTLKRLKKMKLAGLKITDKTLAAIGSQARALLWLSLHNLNLVTVEGFTNFSMAGGLQCLKCLVISSCKNFTDLSLGVLGKSGCSLKHISLFKCDQVTDAGLTVFMKCASALQVLHLEKCNLITGTGLVAALSRRGGGGKLREVQVKKCEGMKQVQPFSSPYPSTGSALESICLSECPGVGDLFLALVGLMCPEVTTLDLSGLTDITDDGLLAFLCGSCRLTTVKVSGCVKVTDRAISAIAHQCGQSLRTLVLDGCKNVSDRSLQAISSHCAFLEDLDVSECTIGFEGLKDLVDATGQTLSSLNLSGCVGITDKILPLIHKNCDGLLDLNLKNCSGLSERAVANFQSRMWNCTILY